MTPIVNISADGRDISTIIRDRLISFTITDELGYQSDTARLELSNHEPYIDLPSTGVTLQIKLGYQRRGVTTMGDFIVDDVTLQGPPHIVTITAKAADFKRSLKTPKTRSWEKIHFATLVERIAAEHGYQATISDALKTIIFPHLDQSNESDLHVLTRLAQDKGAVVKPAMGRLVVIAQQQYVTTSGKNLPTFTVEEQDIIDYRLHVSEREHYQSVTANWYDIAQATLQTVTTGHGEPSFTLRKQFDNRDDAQQAAVATLHQFQQGQQQLQLSTVGNPNLIAGSTLSINSAIAALATKWQINRVEHQVNNHGYRSNLSTLKHDDISREK